MNHLILIVAMCLMVIGVQCLKDGYLYDDVDCKFSCWDNEYCRKLCKSKKAVGGYCWRWRFSCYCTGLPDNEKTEGTYKCGQGRFLMGKDK
uniref:Neurotoxin LmNaTx19 n=1 Tax=Lychas mucronatus TaxID=172552 RepID=SNAJ_LYCMC|nr:RecName: Full=Neurotoxin LmNaTx19; Flags: Precursor [Lychas mucronatus]